MTTQAERVPAKELAARNDVLGPPGCLGRRGAAYRTTGGPGRGCPLADWPHSRLRKAARLDRAEVLCDGSGEGGFEIADPGQDPHSAPDMNPLWIILDTTPGGRGTDWYPKLDD